MFNFLKRILGICYDEFYYFYYRILLIFYGIKNIFVWLPLVFHDQNYDYKYLLILMEKKIFLLRKYQEYQKLYDCSKSIKILKECEELLERLIEGKYNYFSKEEKAHTQKWGKLKIDADMLGFADIYYEKARELNKEDEERKERKDLFERQEQAYLADKEKFFNLMKENLESWWC